MGGLISAIIYLLANGRAYIWGGGLKPGGGLKVGFYSITIIIIIIITQTE